VYPRGRAFLKRHVSDSHPDPRIEEAARLYAEGAIGVEELEARITQALQSPRSAAPSLAVVDSILKDLYTRSSPEPGEKP
jgi:hypothetical protein